VKIFTKHLFAFAVFIFVLVVINIAVYVISFYGVVNENTGENSPTVMLEKVAVNSDKNNITAELKNELKSNNIWAMFLSEDGRVAWSFDLPSEIPYKFSIQDIALFSRGYLRDYPVFIRIKDDGILVLGYPKDSYTKTLNNFAPLKAVKSLPIFILSMIAVDLLLLFTAYFVSKRRITDGVSNWIGGISHDIRTPLSMIMGYADRIASNDEVDTKTRDEAEIIKNQSLKIKDLILDLNLVTKLEYQIQPIKIENVRLSKILRTYVAELENDGLEDKYSVELDTPEKAENCVIACDERLITRAVNNIVQNSIRHNPNGAEIKISLTRSKKSVSLIISDNGVGISPDKMKELKEKPHYTKTTDERLGLRHGLGLLLVRQIVKNHNGKITIENKPEQGAVTTITFKKFT
jgi:signal transduction histidine kinase